MAYDGRHDRPDRALPNESASAPPPAAAGHTARPPDARPPDPPPPSPPRPPRLTHEQRVLGLAVLAGLPATVLAAVLLWRGGYSAKVEWTFGTLVVGWWLALAFTLRERVVRPLQTIANMLAALREGDYSIRGRGAGRDDSLGLVFLEVNELGETLRGQRLGALEATALLRTVMAEIDVAVFAFDGARRLVLVNRGGERLLDQPAERLLGRTAETLDLAGCLEGDAPRTVEIAFPGGAARWEVR